MSGHTPWREIMRKGAVTPRLLSDEVAEDVKADLRAAPNFPDLRLKPRLPTRVGHELATSSDVVSKSANHRGVMVALRIPMAAALRVALPGGEPASDLHCTLAYLGDADAIDPERLADLRDRIRAVADSTPPLSGVLTGYGRFRKPAGDDPEDQGESEDVLWVGLDSPDLPELRHRVVRACRDAAVPPAGDHGFTPHVTLAYVAEGEGEDSMPAPTEVEFRWISLVMGTVESQMRLSGEEERETPTPAAPHTWSMTQVPRHDDLASEPELERWAVGKGGLVVRADVDAQRCVVVKKGGHVSVAVEAWDAPAYVDDLVVALRRIPHDYVMEGRLAARGVDGEWVRREDLWRVLCADVVAEPVFMPSDVLALDGDLTETPARDRLELMRALVAPAGGHVVVPLQVDCPEDAELSQAVERALAWRPSQGRGMAPVGATAVRAASSYSHGPSDAVARLVVSHGASKDAAGAGPGPTDPPDWRDRLRSGTQADPGFLAPEEKGARREYERPDMTEAEAEEFLSRLRKAGPEAEARDDHGRWTDSGGGPGLPEHRDHPDHEPVWPSAEGTKKVKPDFGVLLRKPEQEDDWVESRTDGSEIYDKDAELTADGQSIDKAIRAASGGKVGVDDVVGAFTPGLPDGLETHVDVRVRLNGIVVKGSVRADEGEREAASFSRTIDFVNGEAHHNFLFVDPDHQDRGIGGLLSVSADAFYRKAGIGRIELEAISDSEEKITGHQVWPLQGFDWTNKTEANKVRRAFTVAVGRKYGSDSPEQGWASDLEGRNAPAYDYVRFTDGEGRRSGLKLMHLRRLREANDEAEALGRVPPDMAMHRDLADPGQESAWQEYRAHVRAKAESWGGVAKVGWTDEAREAAARTRAQHAALSSMVERAGGVFNGVQDMGRGGMWLMVTEPETRSTGIVPLATATPETVRAKLEQIRERFGLAAARPAAPDPFATDPERGTSDWRPAAKDGFGGFGTAGTSGILAPGQGRFLRPRKDYGTDVSVGVPLTMIPSGRGSRRRPEPDRADPGGPLFPAYAQGAGSSVTKKLDFRTEFQGIPISVETRRGAMRRWHDPLTGRDGETKMPHHYGYIRLTEGADGDHVDCYLGPDPDAQDAYVVRQKDPATGRYDEDKVMLGFGSEAAARAAFLAARDDGTRALGEVVKIPMGEFRNRVREADGGPVRKEGWSGAGNSPSDGDSFAVGPGVVGGHRFVVGRLVDGVYVADPEHPRVNPYEALFLRRGVRLGARPEGDDRFRAEEPTANPDSRKPRKYPDVGEDMGFNDSYLSLSKVLKAGDAVAVDFDGTITYDEDMSENPAMRELVDRLRRTGQRVVVFTARPAGEVRAWLARQGWPDLEVTNVKSPNFKVMLDDRALNFSPDMLQLGEGLVAELAGFKAWWEKRAVSKAWSDEARAAAREARARRAARLGRPDADVRPEGGGLAQPLGTSPGRGGPRAT